MSTYREQGEARKTEYAENVNKQKETDKAEINTQIDQQLAKAESNAAAQQKTVESDYRDLIDTVAVQRELDRRQISETMANMGLTKSGLNATQQTAVQLSAGNKTAAAQQQRQAAVDALTQSLMEYKLEAENTRRESLNAIDADAQQRIAEYNAAVDESVAAAETAELEANAKLIEAQNKALLSAASSNESKLKTLLSKDAITPEVYAYAVDAGLTPTQALAYQSGVDGTIDGGTGDSDWAWSTTAYRKYGADTNNYGGFLGLFGGDTIDEDDRVEFINSNGEIDDISLEDLYTNLVAEGMSEKDAKAYVMRFNRLDDSNGTYFIDATGQKSFYDETAFYVAKANKAYGKDGVLAELEEALYQGVIDNFEYGKIAQNFGITDEEVKTFRKQGFLKSDGATMLKVRMGAGIRYSSWEA